MDPSEPASVQTLAVGPGAEAMAPVLILPGVRVYVDLASTHAEAARWWHDLGVVALMAAQQYDEDALRWGPVNGHRPHGPHPRHRPRRTPGGNRRPVSVRQNSQGQFELALSPGAGVPDLVAAAGTLPRNVLYAGHRPAAPGDDASVLVFRILPPEPPT